MKRFPRQQHLFKLSENTGTHTWAHTHTPTRSDTYCHKIIQWIL